MLLVQSQAYRQQYGYNSIFLLPVNLYGPGDNFDPDTSHVIPALIRKCVEATERGDDSVEVWGDGSADARVSLRRRRRRSDCAGQRALRQSEPVNLGSGYEISIADLARQVALYAGFGGRIVWDSSRPNGQARRRLDVRRARESFGFHARTSFDDGLRRTVDWYLATRSRQPGVTQTHWMHQGHD